MRPACFPRFWEKGGGRAEGSRQYRDQPAGNSGVTSTFRTPCTPTYAKTFLLAFLSGCLKTFL
jgi:hypothetical protein